MEVKFGVGCLLPAASNHKPSTCQVAIGIIAARRRLQQRVDGGRGGGHSAQAGDGGVAQARAQPQDGVHCGRGAQVRGSGSGVQQGVDHAGGGQRVLQISCQTGVRPRMWKLEREKGVNVTFEGEGRR